MREDVDLNIRSAVKKTYDKPNQTIENCQALDVPGGWETDKSGSKLQRN